MRSTERLDKTLVLALNDVVAHDQVAVDLCDLAITRGYCADDARALVELRDDHTRQVRSVGLLLESLGASIAGGLGAVVSHHLLTSELALIEALYLNSVRAHARYHHLLNRRDLPVRLRGVLSGNLGNERYHATWLEQRLLVGLAARDADSAAHGS